MQQRSTKVQKGEVHLIPFPFTDLSQSKLRPCVVIGCDREDITVVFITSIKPKNVKCCIVKPSDKNNIKKISYIRYTKIATLDIRTSVGCIGILEKNTYQELVHAIGKFIA